MEISRYSKSMQKIIGVFVLNSVDILNQITKNDFITVQEDIKSEIEHR